MIPGLGRLLPPAARRMVRRGGPVTAPTTVTNAVGALDTATASAERPDVSVARQVPYGERPARNRQLTLLAELLGADWRRELPVRFGVAVGDMSPAGRRRPRSAS